MIKQFYVKLLNLLCVVIGPSSRVLYKENVSHGGKVFYQELVSSSIKLWPKMLLDCKLILLVLFWTGLKSDQL